jgi:hypothetical protein
VKIMSNPIKLAAAAAAFAFTFVALPATATPPASLGGVAVKQAAPDDVETVQWRGRRGRGWGYGAGFATGVIIGGAYGAPYYYPSGPYYPGPNYYSAPAYGAPPGDAVAYCMQRFRSYDPGSGTYLGFDGMRHPCP